MDVDPPKVHSELLFEILHITEKGNEEDDLCAFPSCMPSADSRVHFSPSKVTGNRKEGRRKETMHLESTLSRSSNLSRKCPFKDLHATELCTQHACIGCVLLHQQDHGPGHMHASVLLRQFPPTCPPPPFPFPLSTTATTKKKSYDWERCHP